VQRDLISGGNQMNGRTEANHCIEQGDIKLRLPNLRFFRTVFVFSLVALAVSLTAHGQAFAKGKSTNVDGRLPLGGVLMDNKGNLYGTTEIGGQGDGTVFELTPNGTGGWTESILFSFNNADGFDPLAGLVMDTDTNGNLLDLYGTTQSGGSYGDGTVFKMTPPSRSGGSWTESTLFNFNGTDGLNPLTLIRDINGNLYSTTKSGGQTTRGTVFELTPQTRGSWKESILWNFGSVSGVIDGSEPIDLIMDSNNNFYGTTAKGGTSGTGTVFELPATGGEKILYDIPSDGTSPGRVILGATPQTSGNLYGTTATGGTNGYGTVFELSLSTGFETPLYNFQGGLTDGNGPGHLIMDTSGNLYGTTGGGEFGYGTVFELSSTGVESILWNFKGSPTDGNGPNPLMLDNNGNLYGTTYEGGIYGGGTVFELSPPTNGATAWTEEVLYSFDGQAL
jgi:uncharacterized repeat protein (TIGR03803 family)